MGGTNSVIDAIWLQNTWTYHLLLPHLASVPFLALDCLQLQLTNQDVSILILLLASMWAIFNASKVDSILSTGTNPQTNLESCYQLMATLKE